MGLSCWEMEERNLIDKNTMSDLLGLSIELYCARKWENTKTPENMLSHSFIFKTFKLAWLLIYVFFFFSIVFIFHVIKQIKKPEKHVLD